MGARTPVIANFVCRRSVAWAENVHFVYKVWALTNVTTTF